MLVKTFGSAVFGVDARKITIEVDHGGGGEFVMVGLPDNAVKESKERVKAAIRHCGFSWPRGRIVINMAPADIRKEGAAYDLPLALGILAASDQVNPQALEGYTIMGELSLDGSVHPIRGVLPISLQAKKEGFSGMIVPGANAAEASIVEGIEVVPVSSLIEAVAFLNGEKVIERPQCNSADILSNAKDFPFEDFSEVKGQENIKRSLEVAAAGAHNLIMIGPPGAGKTMLARRMPGILPPMTLQEALETTKIHSVAGKLGRAVSLVARRPFRAPHHTISDVALVGGGGIPQPGEISLAHNGVLFLDELPEFKRIVLEVMRQPLEERKITVSRSRATVEFPASFMLVASMNPCPCGYYNHPEKDCICHPQQVQKYMAKISGPLLDRIDIHVEVTPVEFEKLSSKRSGERSIHIRERVMKAREIALARFQGRDGIYANAQMPSSMVREVCILDEAGESLIKTAMNRLGLSARAYDRILKVSRTIADLGDSPHIDAEHVAEAIQYRSLDRDGGA